MATKTYCDREKCGKEILGTPFKIIVPLKKEKFYCDECKVEFLEWEQAQPKYDQKTLI